MKPYVDLFFSLRRNEPERRKLRAVAANVARQKRDVRYRRMRAYKKIRQHTRLGSLLSPVLQENLTRQEKRFARYGFQPQLRTLERGF